MFKDRHLHFRNREIDRPEAGGIRIEPIGGIS